MDHYAITEFPGTYAGDHPVAAATIIPTGALVALDASGNATPAASTVTGHVIGRADVGVDNSAGAAAAESVRVRRGVFALNQDATHPVLKAHMGMMVYATVPDTVAHQGTCRAGKLIGFHGALPIVDTCATASGPALTLGSADSEISGLTISAAYAQAEVQALRTACEELADDVRALYAALQTTGILA